MHAPDGNGGDRAHIDEKPAAWRRAQQAAFAIDDLLDLRRVGEHRNDDVRVPRCVCRTLGAGSTLGNEVVNGLLAHVIGADCIIRP